MGHGLNYLIKEQIEKNVSFYHTGVFLSVHFSAEFGFINYLVQKKKKVLSFNVIIDSSPSPVIKLDDCMSRTTPSK